MRRAIATGLVAMVAVAVSSCSQGEHHAKATPAAVESSTPAPEPLTRQIAVDAFRAFVANDAIARASGDERLALAWSSDAAAQLTAASFRNAIAAGDPIPRYRYESPVFYVPKLRPEGLQWFVVVTRRTNADGKDPHTAFLAFVRYKPTQRWRLSLTTLLLKKQKPPKLAIDSDGLAKPLPTFDSSLVIQPRLVGAIQATLAEEGPRNVAAKVMASGKYTTGYYASDAKATKQHKADDLRYTVVYSATGSPIFPLGTTDGRAIVLYGLNRGTTIAKLDKKQPGRVPVPKNAASLIDPHTVHDEVSVSETYQYLTVVPAAPKKGSVPPGKATIIAFDGGTVDASVPTKTG